MNPKSINQAMSKLAPMARRRVAVISAVIKSPGSRLRFIAMGLPYSDEEVKATLNWLYKWGYVSRHLDGSGWFRCYRYYPTEKASEIR